MNSKTKSNTGKIIAILGPDGSGKTTLCKDTEKHLQLNLFDVISIYGSKKNDQILYITHISFKVFEFFRKKRILGKNIFKNFSIIYLLLVHFPLEYVDNLLKYKKATKLSNNGQIVLFDRYPVDRILPLVVKVDNSNSNKSITKKTMNKLSLLIQKLYGKLYLSTYPMPDLIIFLDMDEEVLLSRRPDFYSDINHARGAKIAYRELYELIHYKLKEGIIDSNVTKEYIENLLKEVQ